MRHWIMIALAAVLATLFSIPAEAQSREGIEQRDSIGWIGISFRGGADAGAGVHVEAVYRGSPAEQAGIRAGDEIVRWNGRRDVDQAIRERVLRPGDSVRVAIQRSGEAERELNMVAVARQPELIRIERRDGRDVIVLRPEESRRALEILGDSVAVRADDLHERLQLLLRDSLGPRLREFESRMPRIRIEVDRDEDGRGREREALVFGRGLRSVAGAEFAELNEGLAFHFGTEDGVLVLRVAPESPAARLGLRAGDVVLAVGGEAVASIPELRYALARAQTDGDLTTAIEVLRRGERRNLEMRWE